MQREEVWGYEALVRGTEGQSACDVLDQVNDTNRYKFDQACRVKAIELAGRLLRTVQFAFRSTSCRTRCMSHLLAFALPCKPPNAWDSIPSTSCSSLPRTSGYPIRDMSRASSRNIIDWGFLTALDDFGAGYAGLNLLANLPLDLIKIDMQLIRGVDRSHARQVIIAGIAATARALDIAVIAEGVETEGELQTLRAAGISSFKAISSQNLKSRGCRRSRCF